LKQAESEWSSDQQDLLSEKESLEKRLEEDIAIRDKLVPTIPADDLRIYQSLRGTKGRSAVALIQGGVCTGCGMEVPSARLARAGEQGLFFCGNCERILLPDKA
jgi:predicted  nucleic acid-binding Zn-ribbon protein